MSSTPVNTKAVSAARRTLSINIALLVALPFAAWLIAVTKDVPLFSAPLFAVTIVVGLLAYLSLGSSWADYKDARDGIEYCGGY